MASNLRRRPAAAPAVQPLEGRQVLSVVPGQAPPRPRPSEVRPAAVIAPPPADSPGFIPMFDGKSTAGWFIPYDSGRAVARNGQVLLSGDRKFFLVSERTYKDFILEADALIPTGGNSGIQFRSQYRHDFMKGYQADIDTGDRNWAGGLWYEGRDWLVRPSHRAPVRPGRWNHYRVEAIGDHIRIIVNGTVTVDTVQHLGSDGHIALQDHGNGGGVYHFKNVRIMDLGG